MPVILIGIYIYIYTYIHTYIDECGGRVYSGIKRYNKLKN